MEQGLRFSPVCLHDRSSCHHPGRGRALAQKHRDVVSTFVQLDEVVGKKHFIIVHLHDLIPSFVVLFMLLVKFCIHELVEVVVALAFLEQGSSTGITCQVHRSAEI